MPLKLWREYLHGVDWLGAFELGSDFEDPVANQNFKVGLARGHDIDYSLCCHGLIGIFRVN
jgi:hypothetical protein